MMEVELVRQRTIVKTTRELQKEKKCNPTWQRERTKTSRELYRDKVRVQAEKFRKQKELNRISVEKAQKQKVSITRIKNVEKTK
ncbi:hypothetical protein X975_27057, partial [Stegodyphus mimosarum]